MTQEFRIVKVKNTGAYAIVDQNDGIIANPIPELKDAKVMLAAMNNDEFVQPYNGKKVLKKDIKPFERTDSGNMEDVTEASEKLYRTHFEDGEWFVVDQDGDVVETATDRREAIAIAADLNTGDSDTAVKVHQGSSYGNTPDTEIDESEESGKSYTMIVGKSGNSGMTDNNPNQHTKKRTVRFTATDWDSAKEKINSLIKPGEYVLNLYDDSSDEFGSSKMNEGDDNTKTASDRLKDIYAPQGATIGHDGTVSIGDYDVVVGNGLRGNDEVISIYKTDTEQDTLIKQFDVGSSSDQDIENTIFRAIKRDGGKYLTNSTEENSMNEAFEKLTDKQLQDKFVDLKIKAKDLGKDSKESKQLQKIRDEIAKRKASPKKDDLKESEEFDEGIKLFNSSTDLTKLTDKQLQDMFIHVKTKSNDKTLLQKIRDERARRKTSTTTVNESLDLISTISKIIS